MHAVCRRDPSITFNNVVMPLTCRLRLLLKLLEAGEMPSMDTLKTTISFAADVLNTVANNGNEP